MSYRELLTIVLGILGPVAIIYSYRLGAHKIRSLQTPSESIDVRDYLTNTAIGAALISYVLLSTGIAFNPIFRLILFVIALVAGVVTNRYLVTNPSARWGANAMFGLSLTSIIISVLLLQSVR